MHLCVKNIRFVSFYDFPSGFCSDSGVFFVFHFISIWYEVEQYYFRIVHKVYLIPKIYGLL